MDATGIDIGGSKFLPASAQGDYPNAQSIAIGASATQTKPFQLLSTVVSLRATVACWFSVGGTAAASTAGSDYLPANVPWMLKIPQGAVLSFIQATGPGWVAVTPMANPNALPLLLDALPGAITAFSLRRLAGAYAGACINVRRSSDNTTQDIGFTPTGDLDVASFNTFIGAGQGYVATWYDQSGNARNATQATAAKQPQVIASLPALGGRPALLWGDGSAIILATATGAATGLFTGPQPGMVSSVCNINVFPPTGNDRLWSFGATTINSVNFYAGAGDNQFIAGWSGSAGSMARWATAKFAATGPHTIDVQYQWTSPSANALIWYDGIAAAVSNTGPAIGTPGSDAAWSYAIGSSNNVLGWPGHIAEQVCWSSSPGVSVLHPNQKAYWGTP